MRRSFLYDVSIYVTSAPFPRITNDVDLDARQPLINRVFNYSMIPIKSRESSLNPKSLGRNCYFLEITCPTLFPKCDCGTGVTATSASMLSLRTVLALLSKYGIDK